MSKHQNPYANIDQDDDLKLTDITQHLTELQCSNISRLNYADDLDDLWETASLEEKRRRKADGKKAWK